MGRGSGECAKLPLELLHVDLATHFLTRMEYSCLLVAVDDASSFTYVKPMRTKSDALQVLKEWVNYAEVQTGHRLKTLQTDNGGEWTSADATAWQNDTGFCWQKTSAYNSEQNGKAEQTIRTLRNMMNHIPYQKFYDKDPQRPFKLLQTFGCLACVHIPKAKRGKLDDSAIPAIFISYDEEHKGWKFVSQHHNPLIFWSNAATFLETKPWNDQANTLPAQDIDGMYYNDSTDIDHFEYTECQRSST
ncbi:uncharacterized protein UDID_19151 [Ustilago sp. UG-2017a]|nr:uncharacterized protein UDID_19151 [Ustilago sp. UG-2017a]